ncbi:N-acetyllactosaminide beta-1,6-N-acetylglucosaminyl-transferase-like [Diadema antillarum]|uniref:N-acetyllactosaminide beta-1,6-N-acetylglucosaminyl-transferase-like n=2 Tax=Diadema antillarum TaxID=105358 RepID=UPI003A8C7529
MHSSSVSSKPCSAMLERRVCRFIRPNWRNLLAILLLICPFYLFLLWAREGGKDVNPVLKEHCITTRPSLLERSADVQCQNGVCTRKPTARLQKKFYAGQWDSWSVSPGHHKHYDVNCSGIIHNNQTVIRRAYELIRDEKSRDAVQLPCDDSVRNWTRNCNDYKKSRMYPMQPLTDEEAAFPIAFILTVHKESAQVERLLRAIYQPQNVYCIHPDAKATRAFHNAIRGLADCFDNVFVTSKIEDVQYKGYTRVQADLNCMQDLMPYSWKYVINLCGQDFPLKTNFEIMRQLKAYKGLNDIPGVYPEQNEWYVGRTKFKHVVSNGDVVRTNREKPLPPHGAKMFFGNAYYAATKQYVEFVLRSEIAKDILSYLSDSLSPDEHCWVTINRYPGVPGGYLNSTWNSVVRFIRWTNSNYYPPCVGKYVRAVCVIGAGYLPQLSSQPHLFVNKIHYDYDPITIQCLEEFLDYRTVFPDTISRYIPNFPVTNLFP